MSPTRWANSASSTISRRWRWSPAACCGELKGHNPIEPAKLGAAILTGPNVESFHDVFDALFAAQGAMIVRDRRKHRRRRVARSGATTPRAARQLAAARAATAVGARGVRRDRHASARAPAAARKRAESRAMRPPEFWRADARRARRGAGAARAAHAGVVGLCLGGRRAHAHRPFRATRRCRSSASAISPSAAAARRRSHAPSAPSSAPARTRSRAAMAGASRARCG